MFFVSFFNHFTPGKAIKPLRHKGLPRIREYKKNIQLRREDNKIAGTFVYKDFRFYISCFFF